MTPPALDREYGMGRGKVFPASKARSLLNPLRRLLQSPARTVGALQLPPGAHVLEVGAGPGYFTPRLLQAVPDGGVVVLDLQAEMVTLAHERVPDAGVVQADAMTLPFAPASFDAAFVATMLGEVPDPARCIAEVRRVLRPGGMLGVAETRRDSDFIPWPELGGLVEPHGFVAAGRHGIRWQYVARFRAV